MCTVICLPESSLFGRTLDYERGFSERVLFTPRGGMHSGGGRNEYAMLGTGVTAMEGSLYFDGLNECGLMGAALNFPRYAVYGIGEGEEVESGLLLSRLLGSCKNVGEVAEKMGGLVPTDRSVGGMSASPLHWIFADGERALVIEPTQDGVSLYDAPQGVLTNSPDFIYHRTRLADYSTLRPGDPEGNFPSVEHYSRGMGAIGLPGDFSSGSRFIRGAFIRENTRSTDLVLGKISMTMRMLSGVAVPLGCVVTKEGMPVCTRYSCCMDGRELIYYFNSYDNHRIRGVRLRAELTESREYEIYSEEDVLLL